MAGLRGRRRRRGGRRCPSGAGSVLVLLVLLLLQLLLTTIGRTSAARPLGVVPGGGRTSRARDCFSALTSWRSAPSKARSSVRSCSCPSFEPAGCAWVAAAAAAAA